MLLGIFGAEPVFWLKEESFAVITLILLKTWQFGSTMLIFLAALQNVSASLYEAANLDGATKLQQLFRITLPIITPMLLFNMVNVLVKAFQEFNERRPELHDLLFERLHLRPGLYERKLWLCQRPDVDFASDHRHIDGSGILVLKILGLL